MKRMNAIEDANLCNSPVKAKGKVNVVDSASNSEEVVPATHYRQEGMEYDTGYAYPQAYSYVNGMNYYMPADQMYDKQMYDKSLYEKQMYDKQMYEKQIYDKQLYDKQLYDRQLYEGCAPHAVSGEMV